MKNSLTKKLAKKLIAIPALVILAFSFTGCNATIPNANEAGCYACLPSISAETFSSPVDSPYVGTLEVPIETISIGESAVFAPITESDILNIQQAWGEGLVAISTAFSNGEDYASVAQDVLDRLYGFVDGNVLFKPTIASEVPFRFTEAEAASYFIGGMVDEDEGFALLPWTNVEFGDDGQFIISTFGNTALWMGSVFLTNGDGDVIRVEKSLGFYRDMQGDVRIQLHHSSVPFAG